MTRALTAALVALALIPALAQAAPVRADDGFRVAGARLSCLVVEREIDCGSARGGTVFTLTPNGAVRTRPVTRPNGYVSSLPAFRPGTGVVVFPHYVARILAGTPGGIGPSILIVSRSHGYGIRVWQGIAVAVPPLSQDHVYARTVVR